MNGVPEPTWSNPGVPERRGRGRPPIGQTVEVRLPPETVECLDAEATHRKVSRAELLRDVIERFVAQLPRRRCRRPTTTTKDTPTP